MKNFIENNLFNGLIIKDMQPVAKNVKRHGLTKIGLPSFFGFHNGRKVKLYGVLDKNQTAVRNQTHSLPGGLPYQK